MEVMEAMCLDLEEARDESEKNCAHAKSGERDWLATRM